MSHADVAPVRRKRRTWTRDEKRRIVDESLAEGASIAEVARRHDLNANELFTWRRQFGVEPTGLKDLSQSPRPPTGEFYSGTWSGPLVSVIG